MSGVNTGLIGRTSARIAKTVPIVKTKSFIVSLLSWFDKPMEKLIWNLIVLAVFSGLYFAFVKVKDGDGERELTLYEAIYFTFTVHFTVGLGDFIPVNTWGRIVFMIHIVIVWIVNMVPAGILEDFYSGGDTSSATVAPEVTIPDSPEKYAVAGNQMAPATTPIPLPSVQSMSDSDLLNLALQSNLNLQK